MYIKTLFLKSLLLILFIQTNVLFAQVPNYVPTNGLVGYWPFSGNVNDESGNNNNGTVNGATLTADRFGVANKAYSFNGTSVLIPLTQQIVSMSNRTVSLWFKSTMSQNGGRLFETTNYSWGIGCYNSTSFDCWFQKSNKAYNFVGESFQTNNVWHNIVFTCDSTNQQKRIFLNGVLINSGIPVTNPGNPVAWMNHFLKIGLGNANEAFIGLIDDIGIWDRALTQAEITGIYNSTPIGPTLSIAATPSSASCPGTPVTLTANTTSGASVCTATSLPSNLQTGLVGYWPFCGNANDVSGNGNNGTVNGASLAADRFGNANSAYSFDGIDDYIVCLNNNIPNSGDFSISFWNYNTSFVNWSDWEIICLGSTSSTTWGVLSTSNGAARLNRGRGCSGTGSNFIPGVFQLNSWDHYLFNSISGITSIYKNGILVGQTTNGTFSNCSNTQLFFGVDIFSSPEYFIGKLDDILIYNRALTISEVQQLFTSGNTTSTYSWSPGGATTPSITVSPTSTTTYSCTVTANSLSTTSSITVTVLPAPAISIPPLSSQTICVGGSASALTIAVSGGTGIPTYQWYTVNGSTLTPITGATNSSYTPPVFNTPGTYIYTVIVSQAANGCNTTSPNAEIIVVADPIISAPLNGAYCQNGFATPLNVTVSGGLNSSYSYQWYSNTINSNVGGTIIIGANSSTYIPPTSMIGTYFYYCIVTNNPTSIGCSTASPVAQIIIVSSPVISSQPQANQSTCLGGTLNALNIAYFGGIGTSSYQWYSNTTNSNFGGILIPGATSSSYLPQSNIAGTVYYYCVISFFSMGSCQSITSSVSTVSVVSTTTVNPVLNQTICAGTQTSPINFTGTPGATYSWTNSNPWIGLAANGNGNIPSFVAQNNSALTITATIVVTPSLTTGNQTCYGAPEIFTITVHPIPLVSPTQDQVVCCQSTTSPIVFYSNLPANFSWFASSSSTLLTGYPQNGTGIIPSFIPINNSNSTETITFNYSAIGAQGCIGPMSSFTITVLPCNISVDPVSNLEFCNPGNFNGITFTGNASSFHWTNNQPGSGIPTFGSGNIPAQTLINNTQQVIVSHIIVLPTYLANGLSCTGNGIDFFINIYPTPVVNAGNDQTFCLGELVTLNGSGAHTYVWNNGIDNGVPFSPTNTTSYIVTGTDVNGCVNSDTIQINVNTPSESTISINTCDSYTLNGQNYTQGGIYTQVISNAAGCDSTITLDLTLNYSPNTPIVTVQNEVNLSTANNSGVTYQWIQCSDFAVIIGQTNANFSPSVNGLYAVVVTNACGSDTSACTNVSTIGLNELNPDVILVYPNPNNGEFMIEIPSDLLGQELSVLDINGRLIKSIKVNKLVNSIDILDLARGSYWLQIDSQQPMQILKQ